MSNQQIKAKCPSCKNTRQMDARRLRNGWVAYECRSCAQTHTIDQINDFGGPLGLPIVYGAQMIGELDGPVETDDVIQATIARRAAEMRMTAYAISEAIENGPSHATAKRYLDGRCSLNSRYVSQICEVLGLELRQKRRRKK
jgi:hypothetical protein